MIKDCIKIEFDYPGMNINSGWSNTLKLDANIKRHTGTGTSVVRVVRNNYLDATLKCYTLLGRMEDKMRVDILHSSPNEYYNIRILLLIFDHIGNVRATLSEIIESALTNRKQGQSYDFTKAFNNLSEWNAKKVKLFKYSEFGIKFNISLAKYDTDGGFVDESN